jgi:YVTN family beta-propeller protein
MLTYTHTKLEKPRAMSLNPTNGLLYVASGDSNWFNVIDAGTNKVVAVNTEMSYPLTSVADNTTGKVYVANCLRCDDSDFTNGTSIYELYDTVNWKTYENISIFRPNHAMRVCINNIHMNT